jgi:hypothetical protein
MLLSASKLQFLVLLDGCSEEIQCFILQVPGVCENARKKTAISLIFHSRDGILERNLLSRFLRHKLQSFQTRVA